MLWRDLRVRPLNASAGFILQSLFLMRDGVRRALVLILYCLGVALFFEATTRVVLSSDTVFSRIRPANDIDDTWWRLNFVRRQREKSPKIWYPFDVYHPTRGWTLQSSLNHVEAFDNKSLSSNSRGLRGSSEHAFEKPAGTLRILTFGDSFTFGDEVSDDETWSYFLEKLLPG